jgi:hypothetical protein
MSSFTVSRHDSVAKAKRQSIIESLASLRYTSSSIIGNGNIIHARVSRCENGRNLVGRVCFKIYEKTYDRPTIQQFLIQVYNIPAWVHYVRGSTQLGRSVTDVSEDLTEEQRSHVEKVIDEVQGGIERILADQRSIRSHQNAVKKKKAKAALDFWMKEALESGLEYKEVLDILKLALISQV